MSDSNAERLRDWLRQCPAIGAGARFGVDFLGSEPVQYALICEASPVNYRENILGERRAERVQVQNYRLDARLPFGSDSSRNAENLAALQGVARWILARSAARCLPEWDGGRVTAILPALTGAPVEYGVKDARYRIQLRVLYETD